MDCRQARDVIRRERDGLATQEEMDLLVDHLLACKNCRSFRKAALGTEDEGGEEEAPRRPSRRVRPSGGQRMTFMIVGVCAAGVLLVAAYPLLLREKETAEEKRPTLVPRALSACSTPEAARELAVVLALDALNEELGISMNLSRLIAAEFARLIAVRARTGEDVGDIRCILGPAYGTFEQGPGAGSAEAGEGVLRALFLVKARAHRQAADALSAARVGGALLAFEKLMSGDFSTSAAGVAGEAIASHSEEPAHLKDRAAHARALARACRFGRALDLLEGLSGPQAEHSLARGVCLRETGRWREAVEELLLLADCPSTFRQAAGFLLAGMVLIEHGQYSKGMRTLERGAEIAEQARGMAGAVANFGIAWLYLHDYGSGRVGLTCVDALGGSRSLEARAAPRLTSWSKELISLRRKSPDRRVPPKTKHTEAMEKVGFSAADSEVSYTAHRIGFDSPPRGLSGGTIETRPGRGGVLGLEPDRTSFEVPFVETVTTLGCSVCVSSEGTLEIFAETDLGERYFFLAPGLPAGEWVDLDAPLGAFEGPGRPFGKTFRRVGFSFPGRAVVDEVLVFHGPDFGR